MKDKTQRSAIVSGAVRLDETYRRTREVRRPVLMNAIGDGV